MRGQPGLSSGVCVLKKETPFKVSLCLDVFTFYIEHNGDPGGKMEGITHNNPVPPQEASLSKTWDCALGFIFRTVTWDPSARLY